MSFEKFLQHLKKTLTPEHELGRHVEKIELRKEGLAFLFYKQSANREAIESLESFLRKTSAEFQKLDKTRKLAVTPIFKQRKFQLSRLLAKEIEASGGIRTSFKKKWLRDGEKRNPGLKK